MPRRVAHPRTDLARRKNNDGNEQQQHPRQIAAQNHHQRRGKNKREELLQELRQHGRHGVLHPLNVVDDGGEQSSGRVLGKKCGRAPQQRSVKIIAQVGDHAEAGVVHQVRSRVVADSLQHRRRHQRERHDRPGIGKVRRHELLQVHRMVRERIEKELNVFRTGHRIQHAIEHRTHQQILESIRAPPTAAMSTNGRQYLPPARQRIANEPHQLPHGAPARGRPQSLAAGEMDMECKDLFYLSGAPLE